jgi:lysozyme
MSNISSSRPQAKRHEILAKVPTWVVQKYHVILVGIRGYYRDSMGEAGKNDRGIYDDAIFVIAPDFFGSWNANTDPSYSDRQKPDVAVLSPGGHLYKKGKHKIASPLGYAAFRPATPNEELPVTRSGKPSFGVAINIHRGGVNGTSSLGCQTIPPDQWESFRSTAYMLMDRYDQKVIPYVLTVIT